MLESIKYCNGCLKIIDQRRLPNELIYVDIINLEDAWNAISEMKVRGAPAIALVALLAIAVELSNNDNLTSKEYVVDFIEDSCKYLCKSRPTAININIETNKLIKYVNNLMNINKTVDDIKLDIINYIVKIFDDDLKCNSTIGDYGCKVISDLYEDNVKLNILTHCNTGSLATSGYGTALGVCWSLNEAKRLNHVYCTETRPYNQGSRLTAYELLYEKVPATLICDNMVAALMKQNQIHAVVVGADRVVTNGDTANKIGTYQIAVLAKYHNVPFYVASPLSTIDFNLENGNDIPIEQRSHDEIKFFAGKLVTPKDINCWNPAFDVTPAELITGIITDQGVFKPNELISIKK